MGLKGHNRINTFIKLFLNSPERRFLQTHSKNTHESTCGSKSEIFSEHEYNFDSFTGQNVFMFSHRDSVLSNFSTDEELENNLGKPVDRNIKIDAAIRMLCDNFIIYETLDHLITKRLRELEYNSYSTCSKKPGEDKKRSENELHPLTLNEIYPGIRNDRLIAYINKLRLEKLNKKQLQTLYMYLTKYFVNYEHGGFTQYSRYLHDIMRIPTAGPSVEKYHTKPLNDEQKALLRKLNFKDQNDDITDQELISEFNKRVDSKSTRILNSHLRKIMSEPNPRILSKVAHLLMFSSAKPNGETFNILIRQLNLYHMEVPSRMVLDVLLSTKLPLDGHIFVTAMKLAISTYDKDGFWTLARVHDLNSVSTVDDEPSPLDNSFWFRFHPVKMSAFKSQPWPDCRAQDILLRERFYPKTEDSKYYKNMHSTQLYTTIMSGLVRYRWYWWVDTVIRKVAAEKLPITLEMLTLNMQAAAQTKDQTKVYWTWKEILSLPSTLMNICDVKEKKIFVKNSNGKVVSRVIPVMVDRYGNEISSKVFDREVYLASKEAAKAIEDEKLLAGIEAFNSKMELVRLNIGHMSLLPDRHEIEMAGILEEKEPSQEDSSRFKILNDLKKFFGFQSQETIKYNANNESSSTLNPLVEAVFLEEDGDTRHKNAVDDLTKPSQLEHKYSISDPVLTSPLSRLSVAVANHKNPMATLAGSVLDWSPRPGKGETKDIPISKRHPSKDNTNLDTKALDKTTKGPNSKSVHSNKNNAFFNPNANVSKKAIKPHVPKKSISERHRVTSTTLKIWQQTGNDFEADKTQDPNDPTKLSKQHSLRMGTERWFDFLQ